MKQIIFAFSFMVLFSTCSSNIEEVNDSDDLENEAQTKPNILLIIADDFGLDACPGYDIGTIKPSMPHLQTLMNTGVTFNNVWSNPTCTPTRAGILTGKYGIHTNVLKVDAPLSTSEVSIQKYLDNNTNEAYEHAVIGKWHLSRTASHPNDMGVNYFAGTTGGGVPSYTNWTLNTNGTTSTSSEYVTSKLTDLAINWLDNQTKPWFLWLAYNAPHTPFHLPPTNLHSQGSLSTDQNNIDSNPLPYYMAALEAMDTEIGRLLDSMTLDERENTIIIFVGDNGTPNQVTQIYNSRRSKGSVYQGGVNVPMIVSGKNVSRMNSSENALINTTDLFATIADIAETGTTEIHNSISFKGLLTSENATSRDYVYTEVGNDDGTSDVTIRNTTHKYILFGDGTEALFDLTENPLETPNLLNANQLPLGNSDSIVKDMLISELQNITN